MKAKQVENEHLSTADAQHPIRQLAIEILETLDAQMGHPKNFPKNEAWYAAEDRIVERLSRLNTVSEAVAPETLNKRHRRALDVISSTLHWLVNGGQKQAGRPERMRDIKDTLRTLRDLGNHTLSLDQRIRSKKRRTRSGKATMPSFQITLVESQTVLSTYRVDAKNMDEALAILTENGNCEDCVDAETLENTFLRFRCIWSPDTGEERPVTDEQNKQLLGEVFVAEI